MSRYIPSKMCPHRRCFVLHEAVSWGALLCGLTWFQIWFQVVSFLMILVKINTLRMRRKYGLPAAVFRFERPNQYLIVRRGWARAAVTCDVLFVLLLALAVAGNLWMHASGNAPDVGAGPVGVLVFGLVVGTLGGLLLMAGVVFCHWMATRPGKPKRVKVPRSVSFQGVA